MIKHNILTAVDIDTNKKSIEAQIEENVTNFNKTRLRRKLKKLREDLKIEYPDNIENQIVGKDISKTIGDELISDDETIAFREHQRELLQAEKDNYFIIRQTINDLNELNEFSAEIERNEIQTIDNFLTYEKLLIYSLSKLDLYHTIVSLRKHNIERYINLFHKINVNASQDNALQTLINMRELYNVDKDYDDIDLYEKFNMESNIDMSNKLSDICFKRCITNNLTDNIINQFSDDTNILSKLAKTQIINNKLLGILLASSVGGINKTAFVSNNAVTCLESTYTNNTNNRLIYTTRTLGELLYEIVNDEHTKQTKEERQQIYMTYDGLRPSKEEYHKWNGLQVYDIDLKEWVSDHDGNIELLKQYIYDYMSEFHWFLWICKSSSGRGLHIYTKVTAPHHVYTTPSENEYISKYWFSINYTTKLSTVYDVLYRIHHDKQNTIKFPNNYFVEESDGSKFELSNQIMVSQLPEKKYKTVGVDNVVRRITAGIRLGFDKKPLVNHNFLDLHIGLNMGQTIDGFEFKQTIKSVLLRETKLNKKLIKFIDEELVIKEVSDLTENKPSEIDLSKFVSVAGDIMDLKPLPRPMINYQTRYNVCNTLASLFGKDGLPIAHTILDSKNCGNVGEINSFYSCAMSNRKAPSKYGLDILKKNGIIKSIEPELKEVVGNNFKNTIKRAIESSLNNKLTKSSLELQPNEYLSDKKDILLDTNKGGITNSKINIIFSPPGSGKCLGKDTPILMYDGTIKMVQDVIVGDLLMGWDSKPRKVLSLARGMEEMYKITPNKGEPWTCNKSHIHSVIESGLWKNYQNGNIPDNHMIEDINVNGLLDLPKNHRKKLFRVPLNFDKKPIKISPYWLGLWLGDGNMNDCQIAIGDDDIAVQKPLLEKYVKNLGCTLTRYQDFRENKKISTYNIVNVKGELNPLKELLRSYGLIGNKHIPRDYLLTDRKTRLFLFAGLIDSDGGGTDGTYDYITKLDQLKDDVCFLARSLGYNVNCKTKIVDGKSYWRLLISGDFSDVPVRLARKKFTRTISKNPLVTGFKIESIGIGDYYGFEIDGDKRFMLGDFTVTHNTELIKTLARDGKRVLLVLPYISVIKNKIETDEDIMEMFDCYYGAKDIKNLEYGINAVTTFDKFARSNYEKVSKMFDFIFVDEVHLLFTSSYRIEATSNVIKKIKELYYISSNDPFSAKICLMTGTPVGEEYFFGQVANIINVSKKSLDKTMEFLICDDLLDATTRLADRVYNMLQDGYKVVIPTNKGEIYSEKIIGMVEYLLGRPLKYGYYKRSNTEQEICRLINDGNTVGDYEVIFCSNYLSVGVDINDKVKFASVYLGPFSGYEIEQFNARVRKTGIKSVYCIQTQKGDGTTNDLLLEEPNLLLRITEEDKENFLDDKSVAVAKQDFIAQYDPVLHKITTPGFSYFNGKIQFNLEEYELTSFENKYNECMQHPVKVARELDKYGYKISISLEFDGLDLTKQEELRSIGIQAAKNEKIRKHSLLVGVFSELVQKNSYVNKHGLEFTDIIGWIGKNQDKVFEDRDQEEFVKIEFDVFATPTSVTVKSKEALDKMFKPAKYLLSKYSVTKILDILNQYVDDSGILKQKNFKRAINLLRLIDGADANELTEPLTKTIEKMYSFVDQFEISKDHRISYNTYQSTIETWTNDYIDMLGIKINTLYAFEKIRDSIQELLADVATKNTSKTGLKFAYNKLPDQDSSNVLNRRSVDGMIQKMFKITSEAIIINKSRKKHILIVDQEF